MTTTTVQKKTRTRKAKSANAIMDGIQTQPLHVKVELQKLLKTSIETDRKELEAQLALIDA